MGDRILIYCAKNLKAIVNYILDLPMANLPGDIAIYEDGYTLGGYGIFTAPRELAKFGQLVIDSGRYRGNQIVPEQWIKDMTTVWENNVYGTQFGYLWRLDSNNKKIMMMGHGGQLVCLQPAKNLIVVITAEVNTQGDYQMPFSINFEFVNRIMSLCN